MKIAMMSYTMSRGLWGQKPDVRELCQFTRELGLDGIDWVTTYGLDPRQVRQVMDNFGLSTVCHTFFAELQNPDVAKRPAAVDQVRRGLEAAATLGTDKVMIVLPGLPGVTRQAAQRAALENLPPAVELGRQAGVMITIEHFGRPDSPFIGSDDMELALRAAPGLKITYDNGNAATCGEDPAAAFTRHANHIAHAHFKDWVIGASGHVGFDGRRYEAALVGDGIIDPRACLKAMAKAGYRGYIDFEYEGNLYDPREATIRGVRLMRNLIQEVQRGDPQ